jgi:hypothetical protein
MAHSVRDFAEKHGFFDQLIKEAEDEAPEKTHEMNVDAEVVVDRILHAKNGHLQSELLRAELEAASNEIGSMMQEIKRKCENKCGDREAFFVTKFVIGDDVASLVVEQTLEVDGPIQKAGDLPVIVQGQQVNQTQVLISSRPRLLAVHAEYKGPDGSGKVSVSRDFEFDMEDDETVLMELGKDL